MRQEEIWDAEAAQRYDTPGTGMFARDVLEPTVDRLAELADGGPALELEIGTGRVAVPLADRGVRVTGIELSEPMVEQLRRKVDEARVPVVLGDMATARAPGTYTLVYLVCNTFQPPDPSRTGCLLPQRGSPPHPRRPFRRRAVASRAAKAATRTRGRCVALRVWLRRLGHLRSRSPVRRVTPIPFRRCRDARLLRSPHRYIWPAELNLMAQLAGFELEARHADWSGAEFTSESQSHVSCYRGPTDAQA